MSHLSHGDEPEHPSNDRQAGLLRERVAAAPRRRSVRDRPPGQLAGDAGPARPGVRPGAARGGGVRPRRRSPHPVGSASFRDDAESACAVGEVGACGRRDVLRPRVECDRRRLGGADPAGVRRRGLPRAVRPGSTWRSTGGATAKRRANLHGPVRRRPGTRSGRAPATPRCCSDPAPPGNRPRRLGEPAAAPSTTKW